MCTEYDGVNALQTNISMGDLWLKGMARGAGSSNRTIQYCMPYPNDLLSASAYPEVTNARHLCPTIYFRSISIYFAVLFSLFEATFSFYGVVSDIRWVIPYKYRKLLGMVLKLTTPCSNNGEQARATGDYFHARDQWNVAGTIRSAAWH